MNIIRTIDLWTEKDTNHYECFNGAFVDGFENNKKPFDEYKTIKNCNCIITIDNKNINIRNKHNAIIFYKNQLPVRLMVINGDTDIDKCVNLALSQRFQDVKLIELYKRLDIKSSIVDLKETPIYNKSNVTKEIDVGSCDRWNLLYNMLKGSYTESDTAYGNYETDQYEFLPSISITYKLFTNEENFEISHKCAFINVLKTRIVPIQENSPLTSLN